MESLWQPGHFAIERSKFFDELYLYCLSFHSCRCPRLSPRLLYHVTKHCKPWRNVGMRTSTCSARTRLLVLRWPGTKGKKKMGREMGRDKSNHQIRLYKWLQRQWATPTPQQNDFFYSQASKSRSPLSGASKSHTGPMSRRFLRTSLFLHTFWGTFSGENRTSTMSMSAFEVYDIKKEN